MNILFLGHRRRALEACEARGDKARLLLPHDRLVSRAAAVRPHGQLDFDAPLSVLIAAARDLYPDTSPDGIIALSEAGVLPAAHLREHYDLPGLRPLQALGCHDKWHMKRALLAAGIACAPMAPVEETTTAEELVDRLGLPMVLKERASSGSRGTTIARTLNEVRQGLRPGLLAEAFVDGVEMSAEALIYGYRILWTNFTHYLVPGWANVLPARLPASLQDELLALYARVVDVLAIERGMTHLEVFLTDHGPVVGEIAARPPGGHLMELIERAYGFDPWLAYLATELGQLPDLGPCRPPSSAGVYFLHPGPGILDAISGLDAARSIPGVEEVSCRTQIGDPIGTRQGVGQSIGRIIASGHCPDEVAKALEAAHDLVAFDVDPKKGASKIQ